MPFPHHRLRNALLFLADLLRYHCLNEEDEEEDSGEEDEDEDGGEEAEDGEDWGKCRFPAQRKDISFISFVFISCPTTANLREISSPRHSMLKFRPVSEKGNKVCPHVGPGTVRACRALLEPAGPRGSDGAPPRRG